MAFGAVINVIYAVDEELYKTLHLYLKWALVIVALLMIVNEIRNWNKPEANFENQAKANTITLGRKKLISMVGLGISLIGLVLFATLDSPLPGSIITSSGLLILYYTLYLFVKK
ncbi:hypothetical protein Dfri01_51200 [Dyadobacter frigoris]|nr:hypothetical protein Dfri01_51200 [Dyadobacter frigoris]